VVPEIAPKQLLNPVGFNVPAKADPADAVIVNTGLVDE
jgi:hypothetical protein